MIIKLVRPWLRLIVLILVIFAGGIFAFDWHGWTPPQHTAERAITLPRP